MSNFSVIQGSAAIQGSTTRSLPIGPRGGGPPGNGVRNVISSTLHEFPSRFASKEGWMGEGWPATRQLYQKGQFCREMPDEVLFDLVSISERFFCPGTIPLLEEGQKPAGVLLLLEGKAKLSLNSVDGRRLIIGFALPGEILGLTSA